MSVNHIHNGAAVMLVVDEKRLREKNGAQEQALATWRMMEKRK